MLKEVDIDIFLVYLMQQSRIEQEMSCRLSYIIAALKKIQKVYMKRPNIYSFLRPF